MAENPGSGMPRWLTIVLVLILVAGGLTLLNSPSPVFQPEAPQQESGKVQLTGYLTGVESTQYSRNGGIEYSFTTPRMSHFQPDPKKTTPTDYTLIEAPFFTFYQAGDLPWFMRARQGRSTANGDRVVLQDDVKVWQDQPDRAPAVITTSSLVIHPEQQVAETDQFVMITAPGMVTRGKGMRADLGQETFAITSEGSTTYEPTP